MKTVPSLVASSTVAIAAAGLALGRPDKTTPVRPVSRKRKVGDFADVSSKGHHLSSPATRPGTSSTVVTPDIRQLRQALDSPESVRPVIHQRPASTRVEDGINSGGRRWSFARNPELSSPREVPGDEGRRDSVSSRSSWMRRLSTIPISQSNSPRSSVGPESPSISFSNGSAAPILTNSGSNPTQLPPNKLVKRVPSGRLGTSITRSGSQSQIPTLRRPATSHQRSVTLQQQFREQSVESNNQFNSSPARPKSQSTPPSKSTSPATRTTWRPFFESRPTKITKERPSRVSSDAGVQQFHSTSRRVMPDETVNPCLVQPAMIMMVNASYVPYYDEDSFAVEDDVDDELVEEDQAIPSTEILPEPHKRARRSLTGKRYSSAPVPTIPGRSATSHGPSQIGHRAITDPTVFQQQPPFTEQISQNQPVPVLSFQQRSRNTSSPLPPLSRLSSFNLDLARLGLSSSASSAPRRSPVSPALQTQTTSTSLSSAANSNPTSPSYFKAHNTKPPRSFDIPDRNSTLVGSDTDGRGGVSGDDEDMDFQSETVYDSLRSGTTGSMRSHNAQLDTMFDESPPSITSTKNKRLSIHELLSGLRDGSDRIVEEDEGMSTPVKVARSRSSQEANLQTPVRNRTMDFNYSVKSSPPSFSLASKDFGRLSLDDEGEDDEDWTRDDESPEIASLSLPSSSVTSRRESASFKVALTGHAHSSSANDEPLPSIERPRSNLFDWSEPPASDKLDKGSSPRPRTAHTKQIADGRGGRAIGRRGPNAIHIRSQSVPVVPDVNGQREHSKLAPKFGTWGLGGKGVSEEWDGDFEFDSPTEETDQVGETNMENSGMIVPPAIQASQSQIVGHVGQIREVCLLVDGLKRLRLQAREKDLLGGESAHLWMEAEGIIALAVPDEEDEVFSSHSASPPGYDPDIAGDRYADYGPDADDVELPDAPFEVLTRHGRPTGFVYDGNTVRRRSVLSSDDDIFGAGTIVHSPHRDHLRPPSTSPRHIHKASSEYARSVMETMHQHRVVSDPLLPEVTNRSTNKMPFDTTSLRDLVNRANVLTRQLAELIRKADGFQSTDAKKDRSKRDDRDREASPAVLQLTRAFTPTTESTNGSPKHLPRSQSNNSVLNGAIDSSPTRALGQRMHMMTVV